MTDQTVLDLSHWQADPIDWALVSDGGTVGVILKATEGESYVDPTFAQRRVDALAAGLCVASYHFLRPGDMIAQMQWYLEVADPDIGQRLVLDWDIGQRLVLDWEDEGVSLADVEQAAEILLDKGYAVAIYGSNIMVDACKGKHSPILEQTSLWQARYSNNEPAIPTNIWTQWDLWQYTDQGSVEGIEGPVDCNRWNGSIEALTDWFDAGSLQPPIPLPDDVDEIRIDINVGPVPDGVEVIVYVNGKPLA